MEPQYPVDELAIRLGAHWPAIVAAREYADRTRAELAGALTGIVPVDTSVVVFGSLARGELTAGSDVDWTLLLDGQAYAAHRDAAVAIGVAVADLGLKKEGREGTFGGLAFSHELVHYIGGGDDTNRNTTRRLLLLLESAAVGNPAAFRRVRSQLLRRYVDEDFGWQQGQTWNVPRFLLNDVARYWRTVAVDFAYKRRERQREGWALRTVKLRLSRKLTYAAGLLACFSCADVPLPSGAGPAERTLALVDHLERYLRQSPLDVVAATLLPYIGRGELSAVAEKLFAAYNDFLALLNDEVRRRELEDLPPEQAAKNATYESARDLGHDFQDALSTLFFDAPSGQLLQLTRAYGVF